MKNSGPPTGPRNYQRIAEAIRYLTENGRRQPTLEELALHIKLSPSRCQRLFSDWAGISPKRFVQYLTLQHTRRLLRDANSVFSSSADAGLSSGSRVHELFVNCEAMTPGEYKKHAAGLEIYYGIHPTPFDRCAIAINKHGVCGLQFLDGESRTDVAQALAKRWPGARLIPELNVTGKTTLRIFGEHWDPERPLYLNVKGTNFQIKVWEALLKIPGGRLVSYQQMAHHLGKPRSARAVASAIAQNPIHFVIPCHRVIREHGEFGGYQGGHNHPRKKALHAWEASRKEELGTSD